MILHLLKMATTIEFVNRLLASGSYRDILSIVKGFRNGIVYGAKIRFPHALVMTFLFKGGPLSSQARSIWEATFTHSRNLASFVVSYKSLCLLLRHLESKQRESHSFIAAFVAGYLVFGKYNKINEQINLYLLSRILYGLAKLAASRGWIPSQGPGGADPFPWFAAVVWGIVLWLFEHHQSHLQPSLKSSMTYLYHDSNVWSSIWDFLIYNK